MLTTAQATEAIREAMPVFDSEAVSLTVATGRVLRQSVRAERDQPPFDRVTMDGIALRHADFAAGQRRFPIQATQAAGDPVLVLNRGECIEIMTGASLPENADCIVPVERISIDDRAAVIEDGYEAQHRQFIHARGSDHTRDAHLLTPGALITPMDIAVIASAGLTEVEVSRLPTTRVISTGNELVPAGEPIAAHQVRMSNGPALVSMLETHGYIDSRHDHIVDDPVILRSRIAEHLAEADVLVLSGGVSMGKADFIPQVLADLGVEPVFHKISQRPGKPMWFGTAPDGQAVFALPGNPVSALVCCRQYVVPALNRASGRRAANPEFAALAQDVQFKPQLTCFMPIRLISNTAGQLLAMPVKTNTSGDFAALSGSDGYVELPLEESLFKAGRAVSLRHWLS
jgi:molybdopterin molybdotransferase